MTEARRVEPEAGRELPQEGAELLLEPQHAGGEEIGERRLYIMQLFEVSDEPAALDGEDEAVRGVVMPAGVGQLVGMAQPARIKGPAPAAIVPAGNADADGPGTAHTQVPQSAAKAPLRSSGRRGRGLRRGKVRLSAIQDCGC